VTSHVRLERRVKEAGSTALIAMAAEPDVLLAVDLAAEIPSLLARLVESENLQHRLITAFGLDQADRAGLTRFIDSHLPDERIDLVVDDASHVLGRRGPRSRSCFLDFGPAACT
jgi:hypothetical protein